MRRGAATAIAMLVTVAATPLLERAEIPLFDARLRLRRDGGWPADLVLVRLDDRSGADRRTLQRVLETLEADDARTIAVDLLPPVGADASPAEIAAWNGVLVGAGERPDAPLDAAADRVVRASLVPARARAPGGRVVDEGTLLLPPAPVVAHLGGVGHTFAGVTADGRVRSTPPLVGVDPTGGSLPSLPLLALARQRGIALGAATIDSAGALALPGRAAIPLFRGDAYLDLVPGRAPPAQVDAIEILEPPSDDRAIDPRIRGKLAVVYADTSIAPDEAPSPLGGRTPGGVLFAAAVRTFDHAHAPRPAPLFAWLAAALALCFALLLPLRGAARFAPPLVWIAGVLALVPLFDLFLPLLAPAIGLAVGAALSLRERRPAADPSHPSADPDRRSGG